MVITASGFSVKQQQDMKSTVKGTLILSLAAIRETIIFYSLLLC